jgi:hypothetical protein
MTRATAQTPWRTATKPLSNKRKTNTLLNRFLRRSLEGHVRIFPLLFILEKNLKALNRLLEQARRSRNTLHRKLKTVLVSTTSNKTLRSTAKHVRDSKTEKALSAAA